MHSQEQSAEGATEERAVSGQWPSPLIKTLSTVMHQRQACMINVGTHLTIHLVEAFCILYSIAEMLV